MLELFDAAGADWFSTHEGQSWVTFVDEEDGLVTIDFDDWLEDVDA